MNESKGYKTVCISIYDEDLRDCDVKVSVLKSEGHTRANRSALIRYALRKLNLDDVRREGLFHESPEKETAG